MRYQRLWPSRRKATISSSRMRARCWEGGLRQPDFLGQRADRRFAGFDQLAQDQKAAVVGQRAEQARDLTGL